jgi:hypothetical protein
MGPGWAQPHPQVFKDLNLAAGRIRPRWSAENFRTPISRPRLVWIANVISDAENGKISTGIGVYVGMMWVINLIPSLTQLADP